MSTINANIVDYFKKIEELTNTNLSILKAINESFTTNRKNVSVTVGDTTYTVPSCLSIENKLNMLSNTVEGLFNIPSTGEACFNSDGNTRVIKLLQYSCAPGSVNLSDDINTFSVSNNNILKDLLTPTPMVNFNLTLPNDIFEVKVRKIIAKSDNAKKTFSNLLKDNSSISKDYGSIYQIINQDINGYEIYDTIHKLPAQISSTGEGEYVVKNIVNSYIDLDGNDVYVFEIDKEKSTNNNGTLYYKKFDGTIQSPLLEQKPDGSIKEVFLRNFDATGKVKLIGWDTNNSTITVKNINGDALNIVPTNEFDTDNSIEESKLYYFNADSIYSKEGTYNSTLNVVLEEDKYVFISIAAINSNLNTQSEWGNGILINTNKLTLENNGTKFAEYYNTNVKNLGDALIEMTSSLALPVTSISEDTYNTLVNLKPETDASLLKVVEINTHLAKTAELHKAINSLDSWNSEYKTVTDSINDINEEIYNLELNNATEEVLNEKRKELSEYENRLDIVYNKYNDYTNIYNSNLDSLTEYEPKYRIRGFVQPKFSGIEFNDLNYTITIPDSNIKVNVIGMDIQYYYKSINDNNDIDTVTLYTLKHNDKNIEFVYPIWNTLETQFRKRNLKYENNTLKWEYENSTLNNAPKFNQINIPISSGERVVMRVRMVYDLGQPFNTVVSQWSDDIDVIFPSDLIYDKTHINNTLTITNNNIQKITAIDIIKNMGVENHLNDSHTQNGYDFKHQAKNIDSGFRSSEQNVISLEEKLREMLSSITELKSSLTEGYKNLEVSAGVGLNMVPLYSDQNNIINLEAYNSIRETVKNTDISGDVSSGPEMVDALDEETNENNSYTVSDAIPTNLYIDNGYLKANGIVYTTINISLKNVGDTDIRLYSLFPGNRNTILNNSNLKVVKLSNYCGGLNTKEGIWFKFASNDTDVKKLQTQNQFITFRMNDAYTEEEYYVPNMSVYTVNNLQSSSNIDKLSSADKRGMVIYPSISSEFGLCIDSDAKHAYTTIAPGEQIIIPLACEFVVSNNGDEIQKTISFDLRVSLYNDPVNYSFTAIARNNVNPFVVVSNQNKINYFNRVKSIFNIK